MPEPADTAQTPVMRQYQAAKRQFPEALLLFRLGDFYELFYDDAVTAARELQITLTARNKEKGAPIPMCGVPYHAADGYIARLVAKGFKVALCEQMEDPKKTKTLVRREVTRVLTPGTAAFHLDSGENSYLAAVARGPERWGLALLDVSTGEFRATELSEPGAAARVAEELARWQPREVLHAAEAPLFEDAAAWGGAVPALTPVEAWVFEPGYAQGVLESHFGVLSLEGFGLAGKPWAAAAAGAVVHYVKETQRSTLAHIDRMGYYERHHALVVDAVTARN
jgi:DNA mismatch repair protein MutS